MDDLIQLQKRLNKLQAEYRLACAYVKQERAKLQEAEAYSLAAQEAQQLAQHVAQHIQAQAHRRIATVVSKCLSSVFGEDAYEFQIKFEKKRGKTEAKLIFVRDGKEFHPLRSSGGGVVDVASFALRLACLVLSKPQARKLLILDEPMKHLSSDYRPKIGHMLETIAEDMGVQIVMVTHDETLQIGKVIEVE